MSVFQGDFLGFTLGDVHSSELNITRVSSGDRYSDILLPSFKDVTVEVPGGDGMYYWNTFYSQKPFTLDFAYDDLRDEDLRKLRQIFGFKGIKQLIFDEFPYKKYMVKCVSPPNFKYICFDHREMRLYKGEGQANLVAYYPYAFATVPISFFDQKKTTLKVNNVGDLDADLCANFSFLDKSTSYPDKSRAEVLNYIRLKDKNGNLLNELKFYGITRQDNDIFLSVNSQTHLVEGLDENYNKTGHLYNKFITGGDFFQVPVGQMQLQSNVYFKKLECTPLYY